MMAGMEQILSNVNAFRDEDLRAEFVYAEFTQIDIETTFLDADGVMSITEAWSEIVSKNVKM